MLPSHNLLTYGFEAGDFLFPTLALFGFLRLCMDCQSFILTWEKVLYVERGFITKLYHILEMYDSLLSSRSLFSSSPSLYYWAPEQSWEHFQTISGDYAYSPLAMRVYLGRDRTGSRWELRQRLAPKSISDGVQSVFMNSTAVVLVPILLFSWYRKWWVIQDGLVKPLHHAVRLWI